MLKTVLSLCGIVAVIALTVMFVTFIVLTIKQKERTGEKE